jgi:tripartite ATP-independent transporter DctM subunit
MVILLFSLLIFLIVGIPVAYALGLSTLVYFLLYHPELILVLPQRMYSGMDAEVMIALPLFVLMGLMMSRGGLTTRLIDFGMLFVGRMRGGLGMVNIVAGMIFAGISGSSVADTAAIGTTLIPEMVRKGYSRDFASGITVASATMGMIIPPSIPMVIYAFMASESVGKLFLAGAIPGIMIGMFQLGINAVISVRRKYTVEEVRLDPRQIFRRLNQGLLPLLMPVFVVLSVVIGLTTATEAAGIGVLYAFLVGFFIYRDLKATHFPLLFRDSIKSSVTVMIITAFSSLYTWILALERVPEQVASFLLGLSVPLFVILLGFDLILLLIGTFVDVAPAIILLTPVFLPALKSLGVSPIQFGAMMITGMAIGLVTPPVGMCLYVASTISKVEITKIFKAALPFLIANLITLILVSLIPALSLWLPTLLME